MATSKMVICPYCGETQRAEERCRTCGGLFEPLSRQATHNAMGPWFVRSPERPFQPGCSYETIIRMVDREQVTKYSILRGPTTRQFWTVARRVPGIAHLLGYCHGCDAPVDSDDHGCHACGVSFGAYLDRNFLGLPEVRPLPWEAPVEDDLAREESRPRSYEMPRPASPTGISSFASDEELLGGMRPSPARPVLQPVSVPASMVSWGQSGSAAALIGAAAPAAHHAAAPAPAPAPAGEYGSGVAMRSMRRKLDAQSRTIRLLTVLFLVTLTVTVVIAALAIARGGPGPQMMSPPPPAANPILPSDETSSPPPDVAVESSTAGPLGTGPELAVEDARDSDTSAAADPANPDPAEIDPITLPPAQAFERALLLADAAAETMRPRAERLADYEEALRILRHIEVNAPAAEHPTGLAARIEQIDRQRERLELEEFFP